MRIWKQINHILICTELYIVTHKKKWGHNEVGFELLSYRNTAMEMSEMSYSWNFCHWLHCKLSFWQLPGQQVTKIWLIWRHFCFSQHINLSYVYNVVDNIIGEKIWILPSDHHQRVTILRPCWPLWISSLISKNTFEITNNRENMM